MANRPSRLVVAAYEPSYDGRYHLRYPNGDKPVAGAELAAIAAGSASASAAITAAIRMAAQVKSAAAASAGLSTAIRLRGNAAARAAASGVLFGTAPGLQDFYGLDPHRYIAPDATGSGNGLTPSNPWTWDQMMANATPGMIIGALPGVFTRGGASKFVPAFNPPSGVTIVCQRAAAYHTTGRTEFRNGVTTGDAGGATIGASSRSNVRWIGAFVDENVSRSAPDAGPVVLFNGSNVEFHGLRVECLQIPRADNHNAVRVEQASDYLLKNSVLRGCRSTGAGGDQNHAAFMTYDSIRGVIEHCVFEDNDVHLFPKGDHPGSNANGTLIVRYSKFSTARVYWLHLGGNNSIPGLDPSRFHHNLVVGAPIGVYFHSFTTAPVDGHPNDCRIDQNTFVNVTKMWYWGWGPFGEPYAHNIELLRNICSVSGGTQAHDLIELTTPVLTRIIANGCVADENHYNGYAQIANMGGLVLNLSGWRALTQEHGREWEAASTEGDPLFANPGAGNYRLQVGSPAAGKGCYVTGNEVIGLE